MFRKSVVSVLMLAVVACTSAPNVSATTPIPIPTALPTSAPDPTVTVTVPEPTSTLPESTTTTTTTSTTTTTLPPSTSSSTTSTTVPPGGPTLAPVCGVPEGQGAGCRLIAYYGNPQSKGLGILGRTDKDTMLASLKQRTAEWQKADPGTPTKCTLELITVVAQASPGPSNTYRGRASAEMVRKVIDWARSAGCLVLLDVQVGWSTVQQELPYLEPFLREPDVHLALDPEWDMPPGVKPGSQIGTMDAEEINAAVVLLDRLVTERKLPPKLLVVHRFRDFMVTNPGKIKTPPTIRLVSNMDGFGTPSRKLDSYVVALRGMPTKLSGFKLFTNPKLDTPMLTPQQVLGGRVQPVPVFINYQ
jgi:hypothetical protein